MKNVFIILSILLCILALVSAQEDTIPTVNSTHIQLMRDAVFGPARPSLDTHGGTLDDIVTTSKISPANKEDKACECMPYNYCNVDLEAVYAHNTNVTGYGVLDARSGVRAGGVDNKKCRESVEVCCTARNDELQRPLPEPSQRGCGYRNPKGLGATYLTTGNEAQYGEFPWVVALLNAHNNTYLGMGVLIQPQVVMTAAHILKTFSSGNLKVRAGEWDTQTVEEIYDHEERDVQDVYIHTGYRPKSLARDIALLRLRSPLQLSGHINTLCLPEAGENFDNRQGCVANGWGQKNFGQEGQFAVILKKVEQKMLPRGVCNTLLKRTRLGRKFNLHSSAVCAGGVNNEDTCETDGGAPLACPIGEDRYKLTSLVSWGVECRQKDVPASYVNVPAFRNWVDDKMKDWGYSTASYTV